ncbi:MAG: DUF1003 domain-containing protein [Saprospirales bacterium]|nr:DUF1003 domain-containing protein [Saprospirales bacterium]MBK8493163.1 DUF1003 domain-containing protein [Saprospirales bacterium]
MKTTHFQKQYLEKILSTEDKHLHKLHQIVADAMQEQELITENLLHPPKELLSRGQKMADKVATFGGSWTFITIFAVVLTCWIAMNVLMMTKAFDPYPFILLNLVLSCLAAIQAPVIMMSQNRKEEKDRKEAENDYLVNLKAEIEVRNLHQKINLLMEEQFKSLMEIQQYQTELLEEMAGRKK